VPSPTTPSNSRGNPPPSTRGGAQRGGTSLWTGGVAPPGSARYATASRSAVADPAYPCANFEVHVEGRPDDAHERAHSLAAVSQERGHDGACGDRDRGVTAVPPARLGSAFEGHAAPMRCDSSQASERHGDATTTGSSGRAVRSTQGRGVRHRQPEAHPCKPVRLAFDCRYETQQPALAPTDRCRR
jgi:hypothetical protein